VDKFIEEANRLDDLGRFTEADELFNKFASEPSAGGNSVADFGKIVGKGISNWTAQHGGKGYDPTEAQADLGMGVQNAAQRVLSIRVLSFEEILEAQKKIDAVAKFTEKQIVQNINKSVGYVDKQLGSAEEFGKLLSEKIDPKMPLSNQPKVKETLSQYAATIAKRFKSKNPNLFEDLLVKYPQIGKFSKYADIGGKLLARVAQAYVIAEIIIILKHVAKGEPVSPEEITATAAYAVGLVFPPVGIAAAATQYFAHLPAVQNSVKTLGGLAGAGINPLDLATNNLSKYENSLENIDDERANSTAMYQKNYQIFNMMKRAYRLFVSQGLTPEQAYQRLTKSYSSEFHSAANQVKAALNQGMKPNEAANLTWIPLFKQFYFQQRNNYYKIKST